MDNWFKVNRTIFENGVWKNPLDLRLFLWLVGSSHYDEMPIDIGGIKIYRGQYLRSFRKLQDDLVYIENKRAIKYSLSQVKRAVDRLVNFRRIASLETELGTLFTIINYDKYQSKQSKIEDSDSNGNGDIGERGTGFGTDVERGRNNTKKELIILIAFSLIESISKQTTVYSIVNKYKKLIGEDKLLKILADLVKRENKFKSENNLAAYLKTCKNKDNQSGKIIDKLKELTGDEDEPGWI